MFLYWVSVGQVVKPALSQSSQLYSVKSHTQFPGTCFFFRGLDLAIQLGVQWYLIIILICISLMTLDMGIFSYVSLSSL